MKQILGITGSLALMGAMAVVVTTTPAHSLPENTRKGVAVAILATTFFLAPGCLVAAAQPD